MKQPVNPITGLVHGTGQRALITPKRSLNQAERTAADLDAAIAARQHLWVATLTFRCDPTSPRNVYDSNSLIGPPLIGCLACDQEWTPDIPTECPGDPGSPW